MDKYGCFVEVIAAVMGFIWGFVMCFMSFVYNRPTAMDVYQNNTVLQITYKDNIPVDSVVVFK